MNISVNVYSYTFLFVILFIYFILMLFFLISALLCIKAGLKTVLCVSCKQKALFGINEVKSELVLSRRGDQNCPTVMWQIDKVAKTLLQIIAAQSLTDLFLHSTAFQVKSEFRVRAQASSHLHRLVAVGFPLPCSVLKGRSDHLLITLRGRHQCHQKWILKHIFWVR